MDSGGLSSSDANEKAHELSKPKYDWPRHSLEISIQTVKGLCTLTVKCIKRDLHEGPCWPK